MSPNSLPAAIMYLNHQSMILWWLRVPLKVCIWWLVQFCWANRILSWYLFLSILSIVLLFHCMEGHLHLTTWINLADGNWISNNLKELSVSLKSKVKMLKLSLLSIQEIQLDLSWVHKPLEMSSLLLLKTDCLSLLIKYFLCYSGLQIKYL